MRQAERGFLWGASTAPHQIEGNNINSDWWAREQTVPGVERSGDAVDSYHRYAEDMKLLSDAGLNAYRFGIEWARIEPAPGHFSSAALAHYRRMIETAFDHGLTPVVTLHHFTHPRWFAEEGGWLGAQGVARFTAFVREATSILHDVPWVCTINEPNMLAHMVHMGRARSRKWTTPTVEGDEGFPVLPDPDPAVGRLLGEAHQAARAIVKENTEAAVGWTVACQALTATPGNEAKLREVRHVREDLYLEYARGDDFIGVQAYSSQPVDANGVVPHPKGPDTTLTGNAYRPDALGIAVRHAWHTTGHVPVLVTENGIATADDNRRIAYTGTALEHLFQAIDDGVDVRGYLHWSALDNFEWGHWKPTFGLIQVDRTTFVRTPKPSLYWLGEVARRGRP
ncbi:beta-glucosidase [Streptomyces sp. alain-838]|nr:beta-glucosidase [Streptomyces sp. alain-838]